MTNEKTKYIEKLEKFVIGEEMKIKRTKGEKVKTKELGVGHLSDEAKGQSVKSGKREYASGTISKQDAKWDEITGEGEKKVRAMTERMKERRDAEDRARSEAHQKAIKYMNSQTEVGKSKLGDWSKEFRELKALGNNLFEDIWNNHPFEPNSKEELELGGLMDKLQKDYGFRKYY